MARGPAGGGAEPSSAPGVGGGKRLARNSSRRPGGRVGHETRAASRAGGPEAPVSPDSPDGPDGPASGSPIAAGRPTGVITLLAGRYRLEERLSDQGGSSVWKAADESLARPVTIRTFTPEFGRTSEAVAAARAAAQLSDPRLVQIFDADDRGDQPYIVTEWPGGERLDEVIAVGPLEPVRAVQIITEAAEGLTIAHAAGLAHLCLTPDLVWWNRWGEVKISGLATAAVLAGAEAANPAAADTRGLAGLLYAALTGYWPGPEQTRLPAAPRTGGRPDSPAHVRPGISRHLDAVTCRALFGEANSYGPPILSPAGLVAALTPLAHPGENTEPLSSLADQTRPFAPVPPLTRPFSAIPRTSAAPPAPSPPATPPLTTDGGSRPAPLPFPWLSQAPADALVPPPHPTADAPAADAPAAEPSVAEPPADTPAPRPPILAGSTVEAPALPPLAPAATPTPLIFADPTAEAPPPAGPIADTAAPPQTTRSLPPTTASPPSTAWPPAAVPRPTAAESPADAPPWPPAPAADVRLEPSPTLAWPGAAAAGAAAPTTGPVTESAGLTTEQASPGAAPAMTPATEGPGLMTPQAPAAPSRPARSAAWSRAVASGLAQRRAGLPQLPATAAKPVRVALVLLILLVSVLGGWLLGHHGGSSSRNSAAAGGASGTVTHSRVLRPVSATAFDPYGSGQNGQLARLAIDGSAATAWHTEWYTTARFGNLKPGTGLLIDMGRRVTITSARIMLGSSHGADFQLRVGATATSLAHMRVAAHAVDAGGRVNLRLARPAHGRYVLIWFTQLPPDRSGTFEASIYNVRLDGYR